MWNDCSHGVSSTGVAANKLRLFVRHTCVAFVFVASLYTELVDAFVFENLGLREVINSDGAIVMSSTVPWPTKQWI